MNCIWSIDNVLTVLSIVLAIIGGTFAYIQWKSANKLKRSELVNQIIDKLRFDKDLVKTMYLIEYDYNWYSEKFHYTDKELEYEDMFMLCNIWDYKYFIER